MKIRAKTITEEVFQDKSPRLEPIVLNQGEERTILEASVDNDLLEVIFPYSFRSSFFKISDTELRH